MTQLGREALVEALNKQSPGFGDLLQGEDIELDVIASNICGAGVIYSVTSFERPMQFLVGSDAAGNAGALRTAAEFNAFVGKLGGTLDAPTAQQLVALLIQVEQSSERHLELVHAIEDVPWKPTLDAAGQGIREQVAACIAAEPFETQTHDGGYRVTTLLVDDRTLNRVVFHVRANNVVSEESRERLFENLPLTYVM